MTEVWTPSGLLAANFGNTEYFVEHLSAPGTTLIVFGITQTPTMNIWEAFVNAIIALALGLFAWWPVARTAEDRAKQSTDAAHFGTRHAARR